MSRRKIVIGMVSIAVVGLAVGLLVFKPWLLFVDVRVDDALPPTTAPSVSAPTSVATGPASAESAAPAQPVQLAAGMLVSHAHETSGAVRIIQNPDGSRVLSIENLATTNGPDVHVWLSAADVVPGSDGVTTAGGATYVDLGPIKGNLGNQVYEVPAEIDLSQYRSVDLWCVQFSVSFGAAQLA